MFKLIYNIGQRLRNPSINNWYSFLKKSESWSREELERYQLQKFKELVIIAYNYSIYYRNSFDNLNITPKDIQSLQDLKKLPVLDKQVLVNFNKEIHTSKKFKKCFKAITSGSSGTSLSFNRNEEADSFNRASIMRGYSWYNVKPWDKNGYFWGFNFSIKEKIKTQFQDFLQNRFRTFNYQKSEFNFFLKKLQKSTYIHGYSSAIYHTAKLINQSTTSPKIRLKMVKGTSEKIFESYQNEIKKAFGVKMISEYGATESGIIAFECKEGNMHINQEGVLVEEVNNEILVTNLQMHSFPIIRYKLGDYIELAPKDKRCNCGMQHQILTEVTGRIGSNVFGKQSIYPSITFYYIFKNLGKNENLKLNYQVIQKEKGKLIFKIEQQISKEQEKTVDKEIVKYFSNDMEVEVFYGQKIKSDGKKLKSFISKIDC